MMCGTGRNKGGKSTAKKIPKKNSIGVEIGVWKGFTSEHFVKKTKHLHLVDSWSVVAYKDSDEHGIYENYIARYADMVGSTNLEDFQKYYDNIYESVCKKFEGKNVTIHRMPSSEFFKIFKQTVDWVYIDGDHSYAGCLQDLENSKNIIVKGGSIFGDDYNKPEKPGVKKAVDEFVKKYNLPLNIYAGDQYQINL